MPIALATEYLSSLVWPSYVNISGKIRQNFAQASQFCSTTKSHKSVTQKHRQLVGQRDDGQTVRQTDRRALLWLVGRRVGLTLG